MGREVSEIKVDFSKAKLAANKAEAIAADIRQLADRDYRDTMDTVSAVWQGTNASRYAAKQEQSIADLYKLADTLEQTANAIRTSAQRVYNAEMAAAKTAAGGCLGSFRGDDGGGGSW